MSRKAKEGKKEEVEKDAASRNRDGNRVGRD